MTSPGGRDVALVLCLPNGDIVGGTGIFTVPSPWPQEVGPLVAASRAQLGVDVTVLRLLDVDPRPSGMRDVVRYLAEVDVAPAGMLVPVDGGVTASQPFRMPWAHPGGPARQLAWAQQQLAAAGLTATEPPQQVRTWNLSSLWRLPTNGGAFWLKSVPPFFAHEGAVIEMLSRHPVPHMVARAGGDLLLADIPGEDLYDPPLEQAITMIDLLLAIQRDTIGDIDALLAVGAPDWRVPSLAARAEHTFAASAGQLDPADRTAISTLIGELDERDRRLRECGLPDTLVHGDFHGGNLRGTDHAMTLLDWGDSGVGHPLLDDAAFTELMSPADRLAVRRHWSAAWSAVIPGSDATQAERLLAPVAALRQAIVYQGFLDRIEPDERVYHRDDPAVWLRRTADVLAGRVRPIAD